MCFFWVGRAYQDALKDDNCLDFDDLLIYGFVLVLFNCKFYAFQRLSDNFDLLYYSEELFRRHPQVISNVKHVLIDEFQGMLYSIPKNKKTFECIEDFFFGVPQTQMLYSMK